MNYEKIVSKFLKKSFKPITYTTAIVYDDRIDVFFQLAHRSDNNEFSIIDFPYNLGDKSKVIDKSKIKILLNSMKKFQRENAKDIKNFESLLK